MGSIQNHRLGNNDANERIRASSEIWVCTVAIRSSPQWVAVFCSKIYMFTCVKCKWSSTFTLKRVHVNKHSLVTIQCHYINYQQTKFCLILHFLVPKHHDIEACMGHAGKPPFT